MHGVPAISAGTVLRNDYSIGVNVNVGMFIGHRCVCVRRSILGRIYTVAATFGAVGTAVVKDNEHENDAVDSVLLGNDACITLGIGDSGNGVTAPSQGMDSVRQQHVVDFIVRQ